MEIVVKRENTFVIFHSLKLSKTGRIVQDGKENEQGEVGREETLIKRKF